MCSPAGIKRVPGKTGLLSETVTLVCLQRPADLFTFGGPSLQRQSQCSWSDQRLCIRLNRPQVGVYADSRTLLSPRAHHVERRTVHVLHGIEGEGHQCLSRDPVWLLGSGSLLTC